ncbi:uncharacterized protein LOC130453163 [Diorhabda sublineata]|uniref:uncharacterized protein LOC130453163 n=1 Tax=Diorhabda sublineata TaxID=1163346 RepID=UPI0024E0F15B|nr:uncharacterized protein LOC130453163 [Diorhabda sublineata]
MLQSILNKLEGIGHVGNMTIPQREVYPRTQLSIQSLDINQPGLIREEDQFILSCVARGSPTINFRWFKDGISINVTATRKWLKLIKDPRVADQYTGLLGIERAHPFDEGIFTCQVEDFGLKECLSKRVVLEKIPLVKIEPFSLTVKKGDNFTIKCITADESKDGTKYIYSWTKNKELLPVRTEFEKYEVLFPSGSILQVRSVDKNTEYSCLVQGSKVSSEKVVSVYVVDRKGVNTCRMRIQLDMTWPETAADTISIINCPKAYTGFATRYCALKDKNKPAWEMPSFSDCTHHQLGHIYEKFQRLKLGYVSTSLEKLLNSLLSHVQTVKLLPGEGAKVLNIIQEMVQYTAALKLSSYESRNITNNLFLIIDKVLSTPESLNQQKDIRSAFEVIKEQISILGTSLLGSMSPSVRISMNTIDMTIVNLTHYRTNKYFHIPNNLDKLLTKWLGVQISATNILSNDATIRFAAGVVFRNISSYMPPRLFLRDRDGSEIEYEIYSHIVTIFPLPELFDMYPIAIDFKHQPNQKPNKSADETWGVKCGYADMSTFTYSWNIYSCYKEALNEMRTRCICPKHGIFALLLTLTPKSKTEESLPTVLILVIGCALGIVFTFIAIICLAVSSFLKQKSSITILKLQCSISVFIFEVVFTAAILLEPTQKYFLLILAGLEASMLLGLSSHLSKLLMIFTELIELPKSMTSKQTVIGIISGVPVITVFASHLSYKTMDVKLESWWILQGTLSFNIFICVTLMMALLFAFIYTIVMKKLDNLMKINEKYAKPLLRRKRLLRRSCYIFTFLILFSISSIIYMNNPNKLWSVFQFSTINVLVGLVILICYVLKSETRLQQLFVNKKKNDNIFFSINSSISSPLKFITKQDAEIENDFTPQTRQETQQFTLVSRESTKSSIVVKSQNIAATFESCLQNNPACDSHLDKIVSSNRLKQPASLEHYNSSPQGSRRYSASATLCSPDILSNKVCVELDLVASSIQCQPNRNIFSTSIPSLSPDKTITTLLDYHIEAPVPARGTETSYKERTQPDGHDDSIICEKNLSTVEEVSETETDSPEVSEKLLCPENHKCKNTSTNSGNTAIKSDNLDGMLDSISQDLEYLLNNSEDVNISSIKSASKGPASLRQGISNVVDDDNQDNITIRSKC